VRRKFGLRYTMRTTPLTSSCMRGLLLRLAGADAGAFA
jgi:hypothetical protein